MSILRMKEGKKMQQDVKFYDTNAFIKEGLTLMTNNEFFLISDYTLKMLEKIASKYKSHSVKAEYVLQNLKNYKNYDVIFSKNLIHTIPELDAAIHANDKIYIDMVIFVTDSLYMKHHANKYFGDEMIELI